jgi:hypothetical protein
VIGRLGKVSCACASGMLASAASAAATSNFLILSSPRNFTFRTIAHAMTAQIGRADVAERGSGPCPARHEYPATTIWK